jgi:hypothetical protein
MHVAKATKLRALARHSALLACALPATLASVAAGQAERHAPSPQAAEVPAPDKSQYTLFNPTPRELWRPLSADRPDFTESPYTVDAGAVQIELSWVDYLQDGDDHAWAVAPANLKLGLLNNVDFQFVLAPYVREDDGVAVDQGFGGTAFRLKINVWGDDEGATALAVMPFIVPPTASPELDNGHVEGGLIVPFAVDIAEGLGAGLMFETDFLYDQVDASYDTEFAMTGVVGVDFTEMLGMYVEGIGLMSTDPQIGNRALLGVGLTLQVDDNLMFDAGVTIGLTRNADDLNLFTGMTVRF